MADAMFADAAWRRSSRSDNNGGQCVEIAMTDDLVGIRDSKNRAGGHLAISPDEWAAFVNGVKAGEFDLR